MTFTAIIVALALLGLLFLIAAARRLRQGRILSAMAHGATAIIIALACGCGALIGANLFTYQRLNAEEPAGELQLTSSGDKRFSAVLSYPNGEKTSFDLSGDEWQVDARFLKWTAFANLLGFDAAYRLERISGRYTHIEDERSQPRTVYELANPGRIDAWELAHRYRRWVPWLDAMYGSATYLPMSDGALYEIKVSQSGLIARPLNQAARDAVSLWHTQ
jgi:hypothetical protein